MCKINNKSPAAVGNKLAEGKILLTPKYFTSTIQKADDVKISVIVVHHLIQ